MSPRAQPAPATDGSALRGLPVDLRLMRLGIRVLLALALLALLLGGWQMLSRASWLALRQLQVEGDTQHNTAASIRAQVLPQLRGNYLSLDLQEARSAFEAVPWVRHAQVRRVWPDQLVVQLQEHQPVAYWERDDSDDLLVNTQGEVFEVNLGDVEEPSLPLLRGPEGSSARVLAMWKQLAPDFALHRSALTGLALSTGGSWRARLDGGAVIELGRGEPGEVRSRLQRFLATVGQVRARHEGRAVESADLRHAEGYALRLAGLGTLEAPAKPGRKP